MWYTAQRDTITHTHAQYTHKYIKCTHILRHSTHTHTHSPEELQPDYRPQRVRKYDKNSWLETSCLNRRVTTFIQDRWFFVCFALLLKNISWGPLKGLLLERYCSPRQYETRRPELTSIQNSDWHVGSTQKHCCYWGRKKVKIIRRGGLRGVTIGRGQWKSRKRRAVAGEAGRGGWMVRNSVSHDP